MFTLSDSRDTGCHVLATADTAEEIHRAATRMGITDAHAIILSDPYHRCTPPLVAILRPHGGM